MSREQDTTHPFCRYPDEMLVVIYARIRTGFSQDFMVMDECLEDSTPTRRAQYLGPISFWLLMRVSDRVIGALSRRGKC